MSTYLYDKALVDKLKNWTQKAQVNIYGPDDSRRLFEVIADKTDDEPLKLPIISLVRRGGYTIINKNKKPLTYDGLTLYSDVELDSEGNITDAGKSVQLNAIPINIPYRIDVYTRYYQEADAYIRDLVFNIINHPTFKISIPYNSVEYVHNANMYLSDVVEDNSNIPERLIAGQFTRLSINIDVDDAYLWDARVRNNICINPDGLWLASRNNFTDDENDVIEKINID